MAISEQHQSPGNFLFKADAVGDASEAFRIEPPVEAGTAELWLGVVKENDGGAAEVVLETQPDPGWGDQWQSSGEGTSLSVQVVDGVRRGLKSVDIGHLWCRLRVNALAAASGYLEVSAVWPDAVPVRWSDGAPASGVRPTPTPVPDHRTIRWALRTDDDAFSAADFVAANEVSDGMFDVGELTDAVHMAVWIQGGVDLTGIRPVGAPFNYLASFARHGTLNVEGNQGILRVLDDLLLAIPANQQWQYS